MPMQIAVSDHRDFSVLPKVSPPPKWKQLLDELMTPLTILELGWNQLNLPVSNNCLKRPDSTVSSHRSCTISPDFILKDLKAACRRNKCTVNDATRAIIGQAVKSYAMTHNDPNLDQIMLASTFTLNDFARKDSDVIAGNYWVPVAYHIPVGHDFKENLDKNKQISKEFVGSRTLVGTRNAINFSMLAPFGLTYKSFEYFSKRYDMMYSNMPGHKRNIVHGGVEQKKLVAFAAAIAEQLNGIVVTSTDKWTKVGLVSSSNYIEHPQELMDHIVRRLNEFIYQDPTGRLGQ